ncbi:interleukin-13 receptor subunit alpha-2-like isoform X1 [Carcharodon carcharias]|uniref:interleukin-13 receptor subunit alpha-2-like isoform X1 n=1 Tax=Carcharodon carcharias TaxID=13397 RepID=UPI001B7F571A|nr:interleukin-13 receptor subunit alpha-2-like isoform X1 [Carcharodon carcharias]
MCVKMDGKCSLRTPTLLKQIYLFWLIVLDSGEPSTQSNDVNCIVYNEEFMECTWSHSEGKPNYTLYHWYSSTPVKECGNYIQQNGYNIGCNFSQNEITQFQEFFVYKNGSSDSGNALPQTQSFQLQNQVKLNPPGDLALNISNNNELILSWDVPGKLLKCQMYEIRHRSKNDKKWQVYGINLQARYVLSSIDPEKLYTFQVRSKINEYCATTDLWSEWSPPVQWGRNDTKKAQRKWYRLVLFSMMPFLGLLILLVCQIKNKRTCCPSANEYKSSKGSQEMNESHN